MLNEAPNNNDVKCIANTVLNEASNSKKPSWYANSDFRPTEFASVL